MYFAISSSGTSSRNRRPTNDGVAVTCSSQSYLQPVRLRLLVRQQRLLAARLVALAQLLLRLAVADRRTRRGAPRSIRLATTSTTREASSTCTVGGVYSGAILTAVCCRLVVAPPMSSGSVILRRSISRATWTISSSDGVIRPLRPIMLALTLDRPCRGSSPPAPSRRGRSPRSCCSRARRRRCSCRCRGRRP